MSEKPIEQLARELRLKISTDKLEHAFLHSSYVNEREEARGSNERLEFLGDAVVGLAVTSYLYKRYPDVNEGRLTKAKSVAVSRPTLNEKAQQLGLSSFLRLGKGERANGAQIRSSILGNAFEALVGVIFLERGFSYAAKFVLRYLRDDIELLLVEQSAGGDYKSMLQETAQHMFNCRPKYTAGSAKGKEHDKSFTVTVSIGAHRGVGRGRSKKEAEQAAAKQLYLMLEEF